MEQQTNRPCRCGSWSWHHAYGPLWYCATCGAEAREPEAPQRNIIIEMPRAHGKTEHGPSILLAALKAARIRSILRRRF